MMNMTEQIIEQLNKMDAEQHLRVLNFVRVLAQTPTIKGESGASVIAATGFFDVESLAEMESAIAEGCEEIDWREWE